MKPNYIVIHTAAFNGRNCDSQRIDQWHRGRGWNGIGYHFVILNDKHDTKADGTVEEGRSCDISGAHARGINSKSLGICCVGHGDKHDFTPAQYKSLYQLIVKLMTKYSIPVENVIGHRELNDLADQGIISSQYRTSKSCPGKLVDLENIRTSIVKLNVGEPGAVDSDLKAQAEITVAIETLKKHAALYPNAQDELAEFATHPEVIELIA